MGQEEKKLLAEIALLKKNRSKVSTVQQMEQLLGWLEQLVGWVVGCQVCSGSLVFLT